MDFGARPALATKLMAGMTAPSRNSACYQQFLQQVKDANPGDGDIWVIADNLSSHNSMATREWLAAHPRIRHAFIPIRACWLNLQEAWWRIFRRHALAHDEHVGDVFGVGCIRPGIEADSPHPDILIYRVDAPLFFDSAQPGPPARAVPW